METTTRSSVESLTLVRSAIDLDDADRERLAQILDDYLQALEAGDNVSVDALLAKHLVDASKLRGYLDALALFNVQANALFPETPKLPFTTHATSVAGDSLSSAASLPRLNVANEHERDVRPITALRHSRVRALAICCTVWWATIIQSQWTTPLLYVALAVTCIQAAIAAWLTMHKTLSPLLVRTAEYVAFGSMASGFASFVYYFLRQGALAQDAVEIAMVSKNGDIAAITLLFPYAMLMPNSVRTALPMILTLAFFPLAITVLFFTLHPTALTLTGSHTIFDEGGLNIFKMGIAAAISLYGVHVLDTLRLEAFEARRLNQYQLGEQIGEGGMGEVYLAEHRLLKRKCAVKLIHERAAHNRSALTRFELEVKSTARLSHPNIIEIYDYGHADDGTFYYVMEYLLGQSVDELVKHEGVQPAWRVIALLQQTCLGLAEAHAAGLLHRDIKPANLFVAEIGSRTDVLKILDFGLVKDLKRSKSRSAPEGLAGTPLFISPEQAEGRDPIDARADIYSLGAVAYYMLTAHPPFERTNLAALLQAHINDAVTPISHYAPSVSHCLEAIVFRCLEKDPNRRPRSAMDLYAELNKCRAHDLTNAHERPTV